jgi:hypothetical protein
MINPWDGILSRVLYLSLIENRPQPVKVVFQPFFNLRFGITLGAAYDVHWLTQFQVVKLRRVFFGVLEECPLCPARMEEIIIHLVPFLGMPRLLDLPAAVETLHW